MDKNVLVTGGAGYIGSHICKELAKKGFIPIVIDNLSSGHKDFVKWGPLIVGDITNKQDLEKVFSNFDIKLVIHLAAKASVNESMSNPIKYFEENIHGTTNLLEHFLVNNGKVLIFSSSCAVYGEKDSGSITEDSPLEPINPYGFSKLASEKLIKYLKLRHEFNFSILRYFNAAGADPDQELGEKHLNETHVIPLLINSVLNNYPFTIYGNDFGTPDGTAIRDYIHVSDLAKAHVLALEYNLNTLQDLTCNLGTGYGVSVLELVNELSKITSNIDFIYGNRRPGDPAILVADSKLARSELNWEPVNSNLSTIFETALNWHKRTI
ncbi:MAG: UDP-glucose 4-epimerase GalE [Synechococcaceae bacterium WB7_1B_046]|nr:UDP-glucose 4-epimerase GalE [Synechococcaceae bacterium WB7_1B_046]